MKTYCLVCKKFTNNTNSKKFITKNGRLQAKSLCIICGNKNSGFISQGSGLFDSLGLNTHQNRTKNALWNAFKL